MKGYVKEVEPGIFEIGGTDDNGANDCVNDISKKKKKQREISDYLEEKNIKNDDG